ncbi:uncharacterized protein LOC142814489 isoform X1 [Rhipicephalus microplus]|uniref:uncharacterized protein LOC142814489 isoform X1 n=1 Tax=Rhipicephalus microplus TaxID=6941 RepID=UPI003F6ABC22
MAETPQAALKEAKRQSNLSVNPKYTVTWHGFLNIGEVGTAMVALVAVMLSSNETTAAELMVVSSFAYGYVSIMMLAGGIVSPYTQALLPLSLYFLLYHLIGSGFLLLSGGWLMGVANGEFLMQVAAVSASVETSSCFPDRRSCTLRFRAGEPKVACAIPALAHFR